MTDVGTAHCHHHHSHRHRLDGDTAIDPVCGMTVKKAGAKNTTEHDGRTWFFCSQRCLGKFTAEPMRYLKSTPAEAAVVAPAGAIYTCPMHPQIRQPGPGSCPICGMALEPEMASADAGPNAELALMKRRFWICSILAVP
ncbi:MAG: YHS domain-containing protein, partial [Reyranellaceae bacterium]